MKLVVLFPGWGTPKDLYKKIDFIEYKTLFVDFFDLDRLKQEINKRNPKKVVFVGWSLGAMMALKYFKSFNVDKLILLAPTLNFLDNQPRIIVEKMMRNLKRNKLKTLLNFSRLNFYDVSNFRTYIEDYKEQLTELDIDYLETGLNFLLKEDLNDIEETETITPLMIISNSDQIIKNSSSKQILNKFNNYYFYELEEVGHNLIYETPDRVNKLIRGYLYDR
ncbi:alpha/beta hydrolase [Halanaerocella petrolearia]